MQISISWFKIIQLTFFLKKNWATCEGQTRYAGMTHMVIFKAVRENFFLMKMVCAGESS